MEWFKFFPKEIAALTDGMTLEDYAITLKLISRFAITNGRPIVDESLTILFPSCSDRAKAVLHLVFSPNNQGDGWIFEPLMDQVDAYRTRCEVNAKNRNSAKKPQIDGESSTDGERMVDESSTNRPKKKEERRKKIEEDDMGAVADASAPESASPSVSSKPAKKKKSSVPTIPCPDDVDSVDWEAWMAIRHDKDLKSSTEGFLRATRREAAKCGLTLQQAIEFCLPRCWAGFTEAYYRKAVKDGATPPAKKPLTPEESHEYKRKVAKMYGYPERLLDVAAEDRYSAEGSSDLLSAVLNTKQGAA